MDAVRPDIADIRLAGRVFAPHYAAPMPRVIHFETALRVSAKGDEPALATLQKGDVFEVLEVAGSNAWGVAPGPGLVGYVDASALGETE
ncbi:SH3 domain-containing protein [Sphingomonas pituitosa]|uniref:SH3 domain-containing protein n=1 Tax=Sphingomonas pituitosa TaxID=99597 RepID=UPI000ACA684A|nr:SH3 domain-containing protein [Sphingomonas pituitosa]